MSGCVVSSSGPRSSAAHCTLLPVSFCNLLASAWGEESANLCLTSDSLFTSVQKAPWGEWKGGKEPGGLRRWLEVAKQVSAAGWKGALGLLSPLLGQQAISSFEKRKGSIFPSWNNIHSPGQLGRQRGVESRKPLCFSYLTDNDTQNASVSHAFRGVLSSSFLNCERATFFAYICVGM